MPGHLGYLRISAFEGYVAQSRNVEGDSAVLGRALNAIFSRARAHQLRGLIIDVRCNPGGNDALGLQIASRLTRVPYLAYTKRARDDSAPGRYTRPQPIIVHPARDPIYGGPIALLTSDLTNSAAETFTQAMMGRARHPVRIGLATQGVFSDVLNRVLPDGILFGLPNEEYLTRTGHTFDNRGIPPDIRVPVFTPHDLTHGRDPDLAAARALLTRRPPLTGRRRPGRTAP
ncbi:MAG: S41 family peptidase [Streptosporangiaceae bacterium]